MKRIAANARTLKDRNALRKQACNGRGEPNLVNGSLLWLTACVERAEAISPDNGEQSAEWLRKVLGE